MNTSLAVAAAYLSSRDALNPDTPLAWLEPQTAHAHEVLQNFWCAVAGAWTWELLSNLGEEHHLVKKVNFTLTQLVYLLSRIATTAGVYLALAFVLADVDHCNALFKCTVTLLSIAPVFSSFFMLLRLRAVYLDSSRVVYSFLTLWLVTSAVTFGTMIPAFHASHIGTSRRCIVTSVHSIAGVGMILIAFTDTMFFLAISYRLLKMYQYGDTWRMRLKTFFGGSERHLSGVRRRGLSHALLRGGQQYYLVTVGMSIATAILPFLTHLPLDFRILLSMPCVALQNAMMCKVHRQLKLGLIIDYDIEKLSLNISANSTPRDSPRSDPYSARVAGRVGGTAGSPTEAGTIIGSEMSLSMARALGTV